MDKKPGCPPLNILDDLIQGKMVEPDVSEYSSHLEECSACQEKAKTLSPYDALVETLRNETPAADKLARDVPPPLIECLKQIPRRDSSAGLPADTPAQDSGVSPREQGFEILFLSPAQSADEIGKLRHYRILKILGRGGMGTVFLAEDPKLGRRVALKVMLPRIAADPTAKDRFLREARAAAGLKNDHIVTIYEVDETNGVPYLAMELLEGQSLEEILHAGQALSSIQIVHIARDIAKGLAAAHEKGLMHRDIKPGNLWLEGTLEAGFRIKVLDFGLARAAQEDSHITQSGAIVGTPAYMAPEQAQGSRTVDARADLFSLGCVLYRLCAGEVPFKAETTLGTLMAVAMNEPTALHTRNKSIPPELSQLTMQLLVKDPNRRPQSAREVIARLAEIERVLVSGTALAAGDSISRRALAPVLRPWVARTGANALRLISAKTGANALRLISAKTGANALRLISARTGANALRLISARTGANALRLISAKTGANALRLVLGSFAAVVVLMAGVVFWQTRNGRVVRIESDDPSIQLAFNDGELKVTGAYKEPITLKPGPVDLRVVKEGARGDGFEFETDKLIVNKGDKIVLKIEVVKGRVQIVQAGKGVLDSMPLPVKAGPIAVWDSDRAVAEWVVSIGGKVRGNSQERDIAAVADLPMERFMLTTVDLSGTKVMDADLSRLKDVNALTTLLLDGTSVTDDGLAHVKNLSKLESLHLDGATGVTDAGLAQLKDLSGLKHLWLGGTSVTDTGLIHLNDLKELVYLGLNSTSVTDTGLAYLQELKKLVYLYLHGTHVTDSGLTHLKGLTQLIGLDLRNTKVTAKGLADFHAAVPRCKVEHDGGIIEATE